MALSAGSIAFVGFNADGSDNVAFVALETISAGTTIFFTDAAWNGVQFTQNSETVWHWTAGSDVAAGTIVRIDNLGSGTLSTNTGSVAFDNTSNRGLSATADTVFAALGSYSGTTSNGQLTPTTFLAAIGTSTLDLTNTGLTAGTNALNLPSGIDIGAFNASRSNQVAFANYLSIINNSSNWITQDGSGDQSADGTQTDAPFSTTAFTVCFVAGTLIATPNGERAVEALQEGDSVRTASGAVRPIRWVGRGKVLATRGRRGPATPVVVRRGALGPNVPARDLRVTKGRALFIDGYLIPVEFLVNHRTIVWDDRAQEISIYHIELDGHDVLIAQGAPAESYRDDGNRWLFQNGAERRDIPFEPCAPVLTGGPIVDTIWRRLLDRAGPRPGIPLTDDADVHLLVDGVRVRPKALCGELAGFRVNGPVREVRLMSRDVVPAELGSTRDFRTLGVAVRRLTLRSGDRRQALDAADPRLSVGFHPYEDTGRVRWTTGDAVLPPSLFRDFAPSFDLWVEFGAATRYADLGEVARSA